MKQSILEIGLNKSNDEEFLASIIDYIQDCKDDTKKMICILVKNMKDYLETTDCVTKSYGEMYARFCNEQNLIHNSDDVCYYNLKL